MSSSNLRLDQGRRLVFNNRIDRVFNSMDPGGRYTPFMSGYRPQLFLRTADVTAALSFPEGTEGAAEKMVRRSRLFFIITSTWELVMPGDNVEMVCDLYFDLAMDVGSRQVLSCFT